MEIRKLHQYRIQLLETADQRLEAVGQRLETVEPQMECMIHMRVTKQITVEVEIKGAEILSAEITGLESRRLITLRGGLATTSRPT